MSRRDYATGDPIKTCETIIAVCIVYLLRVNGTHKEIPVVSRLAGCNLAGVR